jgi:hypothetical protein
MVYEHLLGCFILEDPYSRFSKLFQDAIIVVCGDIPRLVAIVLGVNKLLAMSKDVGGFRLIVVSSTY